MEPKANPVPFRKCIKNDRYSSVESLSADYCAKHQPPPTLHSEIERMGLSYQKEGHEVKLELGSKRLDLYKGLLKPKDGPCQVHTEKDEQEDLYRISFADMNGNARCMLIARTP